MALALLKSPNRAPDPGEGFEARRSALAGDVAAMRQELARSRDELVAIEAATLADGRDRGRASAKLQARIVELEARLGPKSAALAAAEDQRRVVTAPIAEARFAQLAEDRDKDAAAFLASLAEADELLARLEAGDAERRQLQARDAQRLRQQEAQIAAGGLPLRPRRALGQGVLTTNIPGLRAQVALAAAWNRNVE